MKEFPRQVQTDVGDELYLIQKGEYPPSARLHYLSLRPFPLPFRLFPLSVQPLFFVRSTSSLSFELFLSFRPLLCHFDQREKSCHTQWLRIDQPQVSRLKNGEDNRHSISRLFYFLNRRNRKVEVHTVRYHRGEAYQDVSISP